ncbi:hypothetical protein CK203_018195 [Vitis vinifera]|uniref:Uncharacterized protein n=1 Tax=Vitis vinifera TaxID=29760 RepID=A0A438JNY4_VITVI|nr:hypothetical protein CK203_018195 [Vitis vinifera]
MVDLLNWCCLIKQQEELADPVLINVVIITLVFGVSIFGWPGSFEEKSFMSLLGATIDAWGKEGAIGGVFGFSFGLITGSVDAARDVLIDGIRCVPESKMLLEELIKFAMMHGGPRHINVVDAVVANAISPGTDVSQGLSAKDGERARTVMPENHDIHSEQVVNVQLEPEAANKSAQEGLQLVIPKVPGQHREEASEPNVSDSVVKEYNEIESVQALLALSRANDLQQEVEHEPLQDPKSLSLECLSLNPQGKESPESIPASSHEVEAPEEACRSNGIITESVYNTDENPPSSSPVGTSADDPAEIHSESVGPLSSASPQLPTPTEELSQSLVPKSGGGKWNQTDGTDKYAQIQMSPERHKNPPPSEAVPHPQLSVNGAGNWRQMNNADKVHRDSSPRFHGHSRNKRRASRHVPLEQQYPRDQIGTQMLVSQGQFDSYSCLANANCAATKLCLCIFMSSASPTCYSSTGVSISHAK